MLSLLDAAGPIAPESAGQSTYTMQCPSWTDCPVQTIDKTSSEKATDDTVIVVLFLTNHSPLMVFFSKFRDACRRRN